MKSLVKRWRLSNWSLDLNEKHTSGGTLLKKYPASSIRHWSLKQISHYNPHLPAKLIKTPPAVSDIQYRLPAPHLHSTQSDTITSNSNTVRENFRPEILSKSMTAHAHVCPWVRLPGLPLRPTAVKLVNWKLLPENGYARSWEYSIHCLRSTEHRGEYRHMIRCWVISYLS